VTVFRSTSADFGFPLPPPAGSTHWSLAESRVLRKWGMLINPDPNVSFPSTRSYLKKEVNCIEPYPSVSIPWATWHFAHCLSIMDGLSIFRTWRGAYRFSARTSVSATSSSSATRPTPSRSPTLKTFFCFGTQRGAKQASVFVRLVLMDRVRVLKTSYDQGSGWCTLLRESPRLV